MEEIREILQTIAQSTPATTSAAEAVKKAVEDNNSSTTDGSKLIAKPNIVDYKPQEEEIKALREWSWVVAKYLTAVDEAYVKDLKEINEKPNESFEMDLANEAEKAREGHQALWIVSFIDERKGTASGESCGGLQWI